MSADIVQAIETCGAELVLFSGQKNPFGLCGNRMLTRLTENGLLASYADIDDLKVVQAKGIDFFRKHFSGKSIFALRGVRDNKVWYLIERNSEVVLDFRRSYYYWHRDDRALRRIAA